MTKKFVNQLADGDAVDEVFLASEKQLRPNRNGDLYLQLRLSDRTGALTAMLWNAKQNQYDSFSNGDYVRVKGTAQVYNGVMQVIAKGIDRTEPTQVDVTEFCTLTDVDVDKMIKELAKILRNLADPHLRDLAECLLVDETLMAGMRSAPAGVKNHHAYRGGLLEHVLSLIKICQAVGPHYKDLNIDLLVMGAFLHDIGKTRELTYEPDLGYSDAGQLLGHLIQGVQILDSAIAKYDSLNPEPFPTELADHLRHMIVSHHGSLEFGSPKLPMTREAIALHFLDNLDAKLHAVEQLISEDANSESPWTIFNPALGRKIYKGSQAKRP